MELYTFLAQIVNFVIFVFILSKVLFKPIVKSLKERQENLQNKFEEAENNNKEAMKTKDKYNNKIEQFEKDSRDLRQQNLNELTRYKEEKEKEIEYEIKKKREIAEQQLENDKQDLINKFEREVSLLFVDYANTIIKNLANSTLHEQIVNVFLKKISELTDTEAKKIGGKLEIITTFELTNKDKDNITKTFREKNIFCDYIKYSIDESLCLGIELKKSGEVLSWNVKEMTDSFLKNIIK